MRDRVSAGWGKIIGHQRVVRFLQRSLELGRTAHAYLLVGPTRVGKGTLATTIAQAVNCLASDPPCGECTQCLRIQAGMHADVRVIGVSTSSENRGSPKEIAIDQVREMERSVSLKPFEGKTRVFILDGAEHLSAEAANALLKTLEEPPPQTLIILLSAEADALLPTIRSRCQNFTLSPVAEAEIKEALVTRFALPEERASLLAHLARGRVGWALEAASQGELLAQHQQTLDELVPVPDENIAQRLAFAQQLVGMYYRDKLAFKELLDTWQTWWRDTLLMKIGLGELLCNQDRQELLLRESDRTTYEEALGFIRNLQGAWENLEWNANPRMVLDLLLLGVPKSYERLKS